jgi:hypothetical protein
VIITVAAMGVMEPAIDDIVDVVTVWNRFVSAARPVDMAIFMFDRLAMVWILLIHLQAMLVVMVAMFVVHVTIMQIVGVVSMLDLGVATVLTMLMVVIFVYYTFFVSHFSSPSVFFTTQPKYRTQATQIRSPPHPGNAQPDNHDALFNNGVLRLILVSATFCEGRQTGLVFVL